MQNFYFLLVFIASCMFLTSLFYTLPNTLYFYTAVIILSGYRFFKGAIKSALNLKVTPDILLSVAILGFVFFDNIVNIAFYTIILAWNALLVDLSTNFFTKKTLDKIPSLPDDILIKNADGKDAFVSSANVFANTNIVVKKGETIPLDGLITNSESTSVQKMFIAKYINLKEYLAFAGDIAQKDVVFLKAISTQADSLLTKILHSCHTALKESLTLQEALYADIYSRRVLGVFAVVVTFVFCFFHKLLHGTFYYTLSFIFIFSPYFLINGAGISLVFAIIKAAKKGIITQNPLALNNMASIKAMAFEKSSTITNGEFIAANVFAPHPFSRQQVLSYAAALTFEAKHFLAKPLAKDAKDLDIMTYLVVKDVVVSGEYNLTGFVDEHKVIVGTHRYLFENNIKTHLMLRRYNEYIEHGSLVLFIAIEGEAAGLISFIEDIHPVAFGAIKKLRMLNVKNIVMLTKDNEKAAMSTSKPLGFTRALSNITGAGKAPTIDKLHHNYGEVLVIGDALTDKSILDKADISIAINATENIQKALDTADIITLGENISNVPELLEISIEHQTRIKLARKLLFFAKFLVYILFVIKYITLWQSLIIDALVTLILFLNLMKRIK